jgi:hypothetical protein
MSDIDNDLPVQDELTTLKARADMLGISYHPSIGLEKLRAKVNAAVSSEGPVEDEAQKEEDEASEDKSADPEMTAPPPPPAAPAKVETEAEKRIRLKLEASALVRIRVTCMNPAKSEWEGEIFTVGNAGVGSFKKYVPFNSDEGWHVPKIMFDHLKERQCQVFTTVKDERGNKVRRGKLIREFAIEVLPPLSKEELSELARRQAMSQAID